MNRRSGFVLVAATLGFLFLYAPIFSLIIYSFNESKLATVWSGFSTKWYGELFRDARIQEVALNSLLVALLGATLATILGTIAGYALSRFGRFRGRLLLAGMATAPLVMPEVITGISMLLMFVALENIFGWPQRGLLTVVIAHATFCMAYVAVVIQSRLADFDQSLEEAAMDLGARPLKVFFTITLPIIAPALISGWLLAFTLSIDDLVITSFTTGGGINTLPMEIFSRVRRGVNPSINALATIIVLIIATGVIISSILMRRAEKQRERDVQAAVAANK